MKLVVAGAAKTWKILFGQIGECLSVPCAWNLVRNPQRNECNDLHALSRSLLRGRSIPLGQNSILLFIANSRSWV
jgi:hypothetical protein